MSQAPRRRTDSPVGALFENESHSKKKTTHKRLHHAARGSLDHRGKRGGNRDGGGNGGRDENQELEFELSASDLAQLLQSMGAEGGGEQLSTQQPQILTQSDEWKQTVAETCRNGVVKILSTCVAFDFEQPFKRSDDNMAIGTGFFFKSRDLIVTNAHVIDEAVKVWVTLPIVGEQRFDADVVGACFDVDLALLRVRDLPADAPVTVLELGNSNEVRYGTSVLALGYPLGMNSLKLTDGIISGREGKRWSKAIEAAKSSVLPLRAAYRKRTLAAVSGTYARAQGGMLQSDVALNPGNSGGPLFTSNGKVVGINVAIIDKAQNVGFSIPSIHLEMLFEALRTRPPSNRVMFKPTLGFAYTNGNKDLLDMLGGADAKLEPGVLITEVEEGFPMHRAGVRDGDVLHAFDGHQLDFFGEAHVSWMPSKTSIDSLADLLTHTSTPPVLYSRNGVMQPEATLDLRDPKDDTQCQLPLIREVHPPFEPIDYVVFGGICVMDLTLNHVALFHEEATASILRELTPIIANPKRRNEPALVISSVLLGSSLQRETEFEAGLLLDKVNEHEVKSLADFRDAVVKPVQNAHGVFVTLKTKDGQLNVRHLARVLRDEDELTQIYAYRASSSLLRQLFENAELMQRTFPGADKERRQLFHRLCAATSQTISHAAAGGASSKTKKKTKIKMKK